MIAADNSWMRQNLRSGPHHGVVDSETQPAHRLTLRPSWISIFAPASAWILQKPLRPEDLRSIVTEILKRHTAQDDSSTETFGAHIVAAKRCLNLRAFGKARLHLVKALELNAKSAEAFNLAGVLAEVLEDYDKAKKYYGQAIKLDKKYEPAQRNMRRLFEVDHFGSSKEPVNLGEK